MTNQTTIFKKIPKKSLILGEHLLPASWNPDYRAIYDQFYIINCFNSNESFIKIGSTNYKLSRRFNSKRLMPYNYKIIFQTTNIGKFRDDFFVSLSLENYFQNILSNYRYNPFIKFGGYLECFTIDSVGDKRFLNNIKSLIKKTDKPNWFF
jgi:hypothetical protein